VISFLPFLLAIGLVPPAIGLLLFVVTRLEGSLRGTGPARNWSPERAQVRLHQPPSDGPQAVVALPSSGLWACLWSPNPSRT